MAKIASKRADFYRKKILQHKLHTLTLSSEFVNWIIRFSLPGDCRLRWSWKYPHDSHIIQIHFLEYWNIEITCSCASQCYVTPFGDNHIGACWIVQNIRRNWKEMRFLFINLITRRTVFILRINISHKNKTSKILDEPDGKFHCAKLT